MLSYTRILAYHSPTFLFVTICYLMERLMRKVP